MLSSASRVRARGPVVLSIFLFAAVAAACGAASAPYVGAPGASSGPAAPAQGGGQAPGGGGRNDGSGNGSGNGNGDGNGQGEEVIAQAGLLIVKNGSLAIQVGVLDDAIDAASAQIGGLGGYASASNRSGDGDSAQASVTYRIPVAQWEPALAGLRRLGEKVLAERYATEEVTAQVVDLGARIANLRTTEAAFQSMMDQAVGIDEILRVQGELTRVRDEIERLTAQRTSLEGQAAFSTLTVTFSLRPDPILAEQQGFDAGTEVERASASLMGVLQALATAGIWFGIVWLPILITVAIVVGIGLSVVRRVSRSSGGEPVAPAPGAGA